MRRNAEAADDAEWFMAAMRQRQPTGELISAAAVARAVTYLADPAVDLTGVDLAVDGGLTNLHIPS